MPSALPDGDPAPSDGRLPQAVLETLGHHPFGIYLHVPFCAVRCGYCDFNTYTLTELGATVRVSPPSPTPPCASWRWPGGVLGPAPPVDTVFVGGGTPTMLAAADLARMLARHPRRVSGWPRTPR